MNEHIKLLAEHATCYTMSWIDIDGVGTPLERGEIFDKELFAQLIVAECMTTMLKESKWYWDKDEFENANAVQNAARRVKEHFGVKE
jgi:hypothetical protein